MTHEAFMVMKRLYVTDSIQVLHFISCNFHRTVIKPVINQARVKKKSATAYAQMHIRYSVDALSVPWINTVTLGWHCFERIKVCWIQIRVKNIILLLNWWIIFKWNIAMILIFRFESKKWNVMGYKTDNL